VNEKNGTSYDIKCTKKGDILYTEAKGERTLQTVLRITKQTIEACKEHCVRKALVDVQKLEGKLSTIEVFSIPSEHFEMLRDRTVLEKAAIVDRKEHAQSYTFFENVAVNRGYQLKFFNRIEDALEWLK